MVKMHLYCNTCLGDVGDAYSFEEVIAMRERHRIAVRVTDIPYTVCIVTDVDERCFLVELSHAEKVNVPRGT